MVALVQRVRHDQAACPDRVRLLAREVAREVASRVVRYRVEHGLSQAELGAKLGVSRPYVARLESGDQSPTLATLARLAQRLGLEFHIDVTPTNVRMTA